MSAPVPVTHDPVVVSTQDGSSWVRRALTRDGHGLYALAGSAAGAPNAVLATIPELAADHGLRGMAFALPMPVGPEPRTLDQVEDELTGANLSLHEEQLETARLRLALASAQRGRRQQRDQAAALREERHSTNESVSDAAVWMRHDRDRIDELERAVVEARAALGSLCYDLDDPGTAALGALYLLQQATIGTAMQPGEAVPTMFRASHDSIAMGLYTTAAAAREHCETVLRREVGEEALLGWVPDDGSKLAAEELCIGEDVECSGYVVMPLEIASAYDPDADE
jgi:hypothetical protein